jgi:peptidoglycan/LPS O-acetylase OafA/YrhL
VFDWGKGAVDLFFVISGFVLFQSAQKFQPGIRSFFLFVKKRLVRIYPIYWLILPIVLFTNFSDFTLSNVWQSCKTVFLLLGFTPVIGGLQVRQPPL